MKPKLTFSKKTKPKLILKRKKSVNIKKVARK